MLYIKALENGEYKDYGIPLGYQHAPDLRSALWFLNNEPEHLGAWDMLRVEDKNGRILARKERWMRIQIWRSDEQRWHTLGAYMDESEAPDAPEKP